MSAAPPRAPDDLRLARAWRCYRAFNGIGLLAVSAATALLVARLFVPAVAVLAAF